MSFVFMRIDKVRSGLVPAALGYLPSEPAFIGDPYPAFARLREAAPIAYDSATNQWLVARHADVSALLRDRRLGRSYGHVATDEEFGRPPPPAWQAPSMAAITTCGRPDMSAKRWPVRRLLACCRPSF